MIIYLITLVVSCFFAYQAQQEGWTAEDGSRHLNIKFVVCLIVFLCIISGFRYMNYYQSDEYNYRVMVDGMKGIPFFDNFDFSQEWGSYVLYWISANIFNTNQFLIFIAAVITNVSFVIFFMKNTQSFLMVIFLYIAGGAYFTSMNILRQYMAVGIILWCLELANKRKIIYYIILVFLAASIHQSAWLMLPMYLVFRKKRFDKSVLVIVAITLVLFMNFQSIMSSVLSAGSSYDHYLENILSGGYGVKLLRILAWMLPYGLLLWRIKYCENVLNIKPIVLFSVLISACISIVSYKYVFFARIDAYFSIPALCAVSRVPYLFEERSRRIVNLAMGILFFLFGCYQMSGFSTYHNILFENISGVL